MIHVLLNKLKLVLFFPEQQYKTSCSRCRSNITHIQTLLENVQYIVRKDIRAICDLCRTYETNICHLCEEVLRNFTDANIKNNTKKAKKNFESPKNMGVLPVKYNNEPCTKWRRIIPIKDQLFTSEPLQLKVSPILYEENMKVSQESRADFDTNSAVLKPCSKTLLPNKSSPIISNFTDNEEFKPRKDYIYSKKSFPNVFIDAKKNEIILGTLPKPPKRKKSVTFQKGKPIIKILPAKESGTLPFKNEIMISSAKAMLISKTKPYVGNKKNHKIRKFDEEHNLQIHKSFPKLQDTPPRPPSITLVLYLLV